MGQLRKIIKETLNILEEDYESIKQIKALANDVLIFAGKVNLDYILRQNKQGKIVHLYPVKLLDVYQENPKKYSSLQDFIINSNILVQFIRSNNTSKLGDYTWADDNEYDTTRSRSIRLFFKEDDLTDSFARKIRDYSDFDAKEVYFTFYYAFESTLEHEIQHAYDDYRSKSNIFRAKKAEKFREKYHLPSGEEIKIDDPKKQSYRHIDYLKLQHEVWARFTQAVNKTRFSTIDFEKTPDDKDYLKYRMHPIDYAIKSFISEFSGWRVLPEKMKKKLIGKVAQFWHKEAEELPEKNKKELEKVKQPQLAEIRKIVRTVLSEDKKNKLNVGDEIYLPELNMKKKDLIKYLKELYNIELKD